VVQQRENALNEVLRGEGFVEKAHFAKPQSDGAHEQGVAAAQHQRWNGLSLETAQGFLKAVQLGAALQHQDMRGLALAGAPQHLAQVLKGLCGASLVPHQRFEGIPHQRILIHDPDDPVLQGSRIREDLLARHG
jgi:hypothetical protein